ncbi:MAG: TIGR03758 family integrating conjugative element protein [Gammaproteobacteria bacterium]
MNALTQYKDPRIPVIVTGVVLAVLLCLFAAPCDAALTAAQQQAFQNANTGNTQFTLSDSKFIFAGIASALLLSWFAWVVVNTYKAWAASRATGGDAGGQILRALFVMLIVLVIVGY